jgi:CheY-like chemotaxis protein
MPEKILVVDDDRDLAIITFLWVTAAGYEGITACDGVSALIAAETHRPAVILLDIMMPPPNGFEVSRQLKEIPHLAHIPVIFLSAKVQETARREAFSSGAKYFLHKPYDTADLLQAIAFALDPDAQKLLESSIS